MNFNKLANDLKDNKILTKHHRYTLYIFLFTLIPLNYLLDLKNKLCNYFVIIYFLIMCIISIYALLKIVLYCKKYYFI